MNRLKQFSWKEENLDRETVLGREDLITKFGGQTEDHEKLSKGKEGGKGKGIDW